ncbi:MAG: hypothetical protein CMJ35_06930 [Phycisphaerae bacterium]|nr:hypothetical protein [Phycisphaerae bacterium]HCT46582.1 hypothetical protein [Phycisphaerales bacterium]
MWMIVEDDRTRVGPRGSRVAWLQAVLGLRAGDGWFFVFVGVMLSPRDMVRTGEGCARILPVAFDRSGFGHPRF